MVRTGDWLGSCLAEAEQREVEVKDFENEVVQLVTRCFPDQETERRAQLAWRGEGSPG